MRGIKKKIQGIVPGSIAEELGIGPGDILLSINDRPVEDILDYHFLSQNEEINVLIERPDGEQWLFEIEKDEDEDIGIRFGKGLSDEYRHCRNKCVFCFIDQLPKGMRKTLYFKDDDTRLSFLQGNYVTLTNVSLEDLDRVIEYRLSPINISVHTTDPALRCRMLGNRNAGDILQKIKKLADADIEMNAQIVLCSGINDKDELERTLADLSAYHAQMKSVAVVPVGLTKFREGLYPLECPDKRFASDALDIIDRTQKHMLSEFGTRFVYASDEMYLLAGRDIPSEEEYEGYPQLENGVGMIRLLKEEVSFCLEEMPEEEISRTVSVATGVLAEDFIRELSGMVQKKVRGLNVNVYGIRNEFFGGKVTVSGLVTGRDIAAQLKGKELGDRLLIPVNMLRAGEEVFLDDMTVHELETELGTRIFVTENDGNAFIRAFTEEDIPEIYSRRQMYEQTDSSYSRET